ncbi:2-(trimethylamino)ethylphosphonate dioxygenase-like [Babylonia areolata]|uniref:2-(trimethylamino)ethylphosphonate dioxygenase-like n=1 Tax=Babylonia areolata TaxID=304850 RepID=UPI003FD2439A
MSSILWRRQLLRHFSDLFRRSSVTSQRPVSAWFSAVSSHGQMSAPVMSGGFRGTLPTSFGRIPARYSHLRCTVDRGAYDERTNQQVTGSDVKKLELVSDGRLLSIEWGDGKVSKFHSVWLRFNCFCPECKMDHTGQPCQPFDKVPADSRVVSAVDDGEGSLVVQWKEDPDHTGIFPLKYLKANCYSRESLQSKRDSIRVTFSKDNVIPRLHYNDVMSSRRGVYKWMKALNETGITIVDGLPCVEGTLRKVCQRIAGYLQHTVYGEIFAVKVEPQPINAAFASGELKLHMDQPVYESPPGLQFFHCIRFDDEVKGGDSTFVDLFHVAETFREKHPEDFHLLAEAPLPYEIIHYKRDWPVHMTYRRPMFKLNKYNDLIGVIWHPHLMGPLQVEEELVEPIYAALSRFYTLINNFPYMYRHRMKTGEMVVVNNRRVLHGRTAFDSQDGHRFIEGCYVEISEFKSCVNMLSTLEGDGRPPIRVGDNDLQ